MSNIKKEDFINTISEFIDRCDEIYGIYLDSVQGFKEHYNRIISSQVESGFENPEDLPLFIGEGDPNDPNNIIYHKTTQGEYKIRNSTAGKNYILLGRYVIILIYQYWDSEFRSRIASSLGYSDAKNVIIPLFGDIRLLRHNILHSNGVLNKDTNKRLEVIQGFREGSEIILNEVAIHSIIRAIKIVLDEYVLSHVSFDPMYRTIWHVR